MSLKSSKSYVRLDIPLLKPHWLLPDISSLFRCLVSPLFTCPVCSILQAVTPIYSVPACGASSCSQPLCKDLTQNKSKHIKSATAIWCCNLGKIIQMSLGSLIYLHEHAESSFKEISEAWWHMLNINRIRSIRITDLFHHLFQQWFVRSLHKKNNTPWVKLFTLDARAVSLLNFSFPLKETEIFIIERKSLTDV